MDLDNTIRQEKQITVLKIEKIIEFFAFLENKICRLVLELFGDFFILGDFNKNID